MLPCILSHSPQNETIITGLEAGTAYAYMTASVKVNTVIVYHPLVSCDSDALDINVLTESEKHSPAWGILEGGALKTDSVTVDELDHPRTFYRWFREISGSHACSVEKLEPVTSRRASFFK